MKEFATVESAKLAVAKAGVFLAAIQGLCPDLGT